MKRENELIKMALLAVRQESSLVSRSYMIKDIAIELANDGKTLDAICFCNAIFEPENVFEVLIVTSIEMLKRGEKEIAMNILESVKSICVAQVNSFHYGFPYARITKNLDQPDMVGLEESTHYILTILLTMSAQLESSEHKLRCYRNILPSLAMHWREKAEELLDHLLGLSFNDLFGAGFMNAGSVLCEIALIIKKNDLIWNEKRQECFQKLMDSVPKYKEPDSDTEFDVEAFHERMDLELLKMQELRAKLSSDFENAVQRIITTYKVRFQP